MHIEYELLSPVPGCDRQTLSLEITPESFVRELATARTFVRESEVQALRAAGLGCRRRRATCLSSTPTGSPVQNALRRPDECVRHKILDCIGDFALGGGTSAGQVQRHSGPGTATIMIWSGESRIRSSASGGAPPVA